MVEPTAVEIIAVAQTGLETGWEPEREFRTIWDSVEWLHKNHPEIDLDKQYTPRKRFNSSGLDQFVRFEKIASCLRVNILEANMATDALATSDKELAFESLRRMPDDVSLQEISEELAILAAIRRGEAAAEAGRVLTHDEVTRRSMAWTSR